MGVLELIAKVKKCTERKGKRWYAGYGQVIGVFVAPFSLLCWDNYSKIRARICEVKAKGIGGKGDGEKNGDNLAHLIFTFTMGPPLLLLFTGHDEISSS
ncbi:hypothetical protein HZH68_002843 [Vespula germanica]|uniref:Uncharacterized protein n=1 Tax=Vespula germanica TaxID=30212 RepID=A0A834NN56_VESGE|nr:hypothetical protein HZH68_002843 [Vespula germanica]